MQIIAAEVVNDNVVAIVVAEEVEFVAEQSVAVEVVPKKQRQCWCFSSGSLKERSDY